MDIKIANKITVEKINRFGFGYNSKRGIWERFIPSTFRFQYVLCITEYDFWGEVRGMTKGTESYDIDKWLERLFFRNSEKKEEINNLLLELMQAGFIYDEDKELMPLTEYELFLKAFNNSLSSSYFLYENHEMDNSSADNDIELFFKNLEFNEFRFIGFSLSPAEYQKTDYIGLMFENKKNFDWFWYHLHKDVFENMQKRLNKG